MLDILRKKSSTFAVYFVFAILIVIFAVGFGAVSPDKGCGGQDVPGGAKVTMVEVDGQDVDSLLVRAAGELTGDAPNPKQGRGGYDYVTRYWQMALFGPFSGAAYGADPEKVSPIKVVKVIDDLIETKLVSAYARSLGLGISKAELNDAMALRLSAFRDKKTGELKLAGYRGWVTGSLGMSVASFEKLVEDELLRERVIQLLVGEIGASDAEVALAYKLENDKVTVDVVTVDEAAAAPLVPVTDAEVSEWLGKNEEKAKAEYESLKASKYTTPKTLKLRGIKIDAPDLEAAADDEQRKGYQDERNAAKAKAEKALADYKAKLVVPDQGADGAPPVVVDRVTEFGAIASAVSDDASKAAGGLLGSVSVRLLGQSPYGPNVAAAVETMKPLEVTEVLETGSGFWVLLPEEITDEKVEAYDAVKSAVAKSLVQREKAATFVKTLADEVLAEAKKDTTKKLDDVVKAVNGKYGATDGLSVSQASFSRLSRLFEGAPASSPFLFELGGRAPELVAAAFGASAEAPLIDKVFSFDEGKKLVVARFAEKKAADPQSDEDKNKLRQTLALEKRRAIYRGWYEDLLAKKIEAGDIEYTKHFATAKKEAEEAYVQAGGTLPGMAAKAPAAVTPTVELKP
ncbi:MAG: SurA N-terminal domain-containing protein [Deltaproteobacteria bacterium]|nr:SurA N-terminal domain-containing protein [Deltaproteobacteria bacterium]